MSSPKDPDYNCAAYVADDRTQKWAYTMVPQPGYYWPKGAIEDDDPDALKSAYETIGYELDTGDRAAEPEDGYEKLAIYVDDYGLWSHAAKLGADGEWSSKLGDSYDVTHKSQHCFGDSGPEYGNVAYYMRRKI